jgi:hypothetical protein
MRAKIENAVPANPDLFHVRSVFSIVRLEADLRDLRHLVFPAAGGKYVQLGCKITLPSLVFLFATELQIELSGQTPQHFINWCPLHSP